MVKRFLLLVSALVLMISCQEPAREEVEYNPAEDFVLITDVIPDALLDIRYYSEYNFIGDRIPGYEQPVAIISKQACDSLKAVADELRTKGYLIRIYDAYRPQDAVDYFMKWGADIADVRMKEYFYPEIDKKRIVPEQFVAEKSSHTRGSTVDLTLFDMKLQRDVDMGSTFDYFGPVSNPSAQPGQEVGAYKPLNQAQYDNRMLLRNTMIAHGFEPYFSEWWHFTLAGEPFPDTYFNFPVSTESVKNR